MIYDAAIIGLGTMGAAHASSSRVAGGVSSAADSLAPPHDRGSHSGATRVSHSLRHPLIMCLWHVQLRVCVCVCVCVRIPTCVLSVCVVVNIYISPSMFASQAIFFYGFPNIGSWCMCMLTTRAISDHVFQGR